MDNILGIAMSLCFPKQINVGFHSYIASQIGFHFLGYLKTLHTTDLEALGEETPNPSAELLPLHLETFYGSGSHDEWIVM